MVKKQIAKRKLAVDNAFKVGLMTEEHVPLRPRVKKMDTGVDHARNEKCA